MDLTPGSVAFGSEQVDPAPGHLTAPLSSDQFLSSALEGAGVGTWQVDMETGLVTWDSTTSVLFGLQKIPMMSGASLPVHPDDHPRVWASLDHSRATGEPHDILFRGTHSDGSLRWFHGLGKPYPAGALNARFIAGTISDVTDRKLGQDAREESERQLASIIANLPGIAYRCETKAPWTMTFISEAVAELTGHAAEEFLSNRVTWDSLIVPEHRPMVSDQVARAICDRRPYELRYRISNRAGEDRWVQERGAALYSDTGEALFLEGFIGDVHDQTILEERLRETEELFRLGSTATQDIIWDYDLTTGRVRWNAALRDGLGHSVSRLESDIEWWEQRVHPEERPRVHRELSDSISSENGRFESQYSFLKADGSYADILDRGFVIRDEVGRPIRMVGAMLDNTERNASTKLLRDREARLSTVFGQAMVGIMQRSLTGELLMINDRYCEILGRTEEEIRGLDVSECTHPDDAQWNRKTLFERVKNGKPLHTEKRYIRPDGSIVWCDVIVTLVDPGDQQDGSVIVIAHDISDRKAAESALRQSELMYRSILEASEDCIKIIDLEGRIELMNPPGVRAMEIEEFENVRGSSWVDTWPRKSHAIVKSALEKAFAGESTRFSAFCPTVKGSPKWWDVVTSPMLDQGGGVTKVLAISRDITVQRKAAAEVKWASEHDPLTGLANRRAFESRLQAATIRAMQSHSSVGLLLLDLDHFKHVNDTLGHAAGDKLLTEFGKRLQQCLRSSDFVARLGGDEFAVIIETKNNELDLPEAGRSILDRLKEPISYKGRVMSAGASIGGAIFPADAQSANELFNNADTALYALKDSGRGGTRMFHQHMREQAQLASSQLSLARNAITSQSVEPHYQQKINLLSGEIAGFEALLRWHHGTRGIQPPDTVAEAFNDYELATRIGDLMQNRIFRDMRAWLDGGLPIGFVAFNAAPVEFLRDDFAERVLTRMSEHGVPANLVEIEITEHAFIERGSEFVARALNELSRAGVRIALDDFGTGSSSLSHLRDYPVDVVKIDRSFIDKVTTDSEVCAIVCAVIDLAKSLHIEVVAEGVETVDQQRFLARRGCDTGQGYLYGRAVHADEIPSLLEARNGLSIAC